MRVPARLAVTAIAAVLAGAPAAALAQSAGDEQYVDPFATPTAQAAPRATSTPAPLAPRPPASIAPPATATAAPQATTTSGPTRLARTGADATLVALACLGLVAGGLGLRRLTHDAAR
jgi:hypothetical protein